MASKAGILGSLRTRLERNRIGEVLVRRGHLTPQQLKSALARQSSERQPLGKILIETGLIRRRDIATAIMAQWAMRSTVTALSAMIALSAFSPKTASAAETAQIRMASTPAASDLAAYPGLFGTEEKKSEDLKAFTKWREMFNRFDKQMASNDSAAVVGKWQSRLEKIKGQSLDRMVESVNAMANEMRYIGDDKNWGKSDYWETPVEFFTKGGDCEDFAIAKYASLRALGVPDSRMRVAIVKDTQKGIPHAILIVYTDTGVKILDNQIKSVRADNSIAHYKPIFSINKTAWWLHSAPQAIAVASR